MTEEIKKSECESCSSMGGCMHNHKHIWKKVLVIIIIIFAFNVGVKLGEIKGELRSLRDIRGGYGMMNGVWDKDADNANYGNYYGRGMMGIFGNSKLVPAGQAPTTTTPSTPAKQ